MLDDNGVYYRDYNVEITDATTSQVVSIVNIIETTLSSSELIELILSNLITSIEQQDNGDTNFIISSITGQVLQDDETTENNNGNKNNFNIYTLENVVLFAVIMSLICVIISIFVRVAVIKKRLKMQENTTTSQLQPVKIMSTTTTTLHIERMDNSGNSTPNPTGSSDHDRDSENADFLQMVQLQLQANELKNMGGHDDGDQDGEDSERLYDQAIADPMTPGSDNINLKEKDIDIDIQLPKQPIINVDSIVAIVTQNVKGEEDDNQQFEQEGVPHLTDQLQLHQNSNITMASTNLSRPIGTMQNTANNGVFVE